MPLLYTLPEWIKIYMPSIQNQGATSNTPKRVENSRSMGVFQKDKNNPSSSQKVDHRNIRKERLLVLRGPRNTFLFTHFIVFKSTKKFPRAQISNPFHKNITTHNKSKLPFQDFLHFSFPTMTRVSKSRGSSPQRGVKSCFHKSSKKSEGARTDNEPSPKSQQGQTTMW